MSKRKKQKTEEENTNLPLIVDEIHQHIQTQTEQLFHESQQKDDAFQTDLKKNTYFYYFIGRLNPPHQGHLAALRLLVDTSNRNNSIPLILLGSGPKGERTLDNPITYELKSRFIRSKLQGEYILKEMKNPTMDISQYIKTSLENKNSPIENVQITHFSGNKEEDSVKLNFIHPFASKAALSVASHANIQIHTKAITPIQQEGIEMSATRVRKDAYHFFLDGSGKNAFAAKYNWFYEDDTSSIYDEIIEPATKLSREQLEEYIETGKISTTRKRKSSKHIKSGGKKSKKQKRKIRKTNYK